MIGWTLGDALVRALIALAPSPGTSSGDDSEAREMVNRPVARDERAGIETELIGSDGTTRERIATIYVEARDGGNDMRLLRLHSPPDVADAAILAIEHDDRASDPWLDPPAVQFLERGR